jgi:hypothetical protein
MVSDNELKEQLIVEIRSEMDSDDEVALEFAYDIGVTPWVVIGTTDNEETEDWEDCDNEGINSTKEAVLEWIEDSSIDDICEIESFKNLLDEM